MDKKDQHSSLDSSPQSQKDSFGGDGSFDSSPFGEGAAGLSAMGPARMNTSSDGGEASDEISLKELILKLQEWWKYLLTKWVIILIAGIIGGIAGVIYAYSKKTVYTAELTFVLEGGSQGGGLANYAGLASQFGVNMGSGQGVFEGENFLSLMKSRLMIEKALMTPVKVNNRTITLSEFYIDINKLRQKWSKDNPKLKTIRFLPGSDPSKFSKEQNSTISNFHKTLITNNLFIDKQDKKSSIIVLRVNSANELFSKYFAEVLAKEVSKFYVETKTKKSVDNVRILQHQTDSIKGALNLSMIGVAASVDANPNPNSARQILHVPSQRRQGDVQANQAILGQLVQNLEIAKMSLRTETPLIQIIDRPILPLPKTRVSKTTSVLAGGIIGGFLMTLFIVIRKFLGNL